MRPNRTVRILRRLAPDVARRAMKTRAIAAVGARPVTVIVIVIVIVTVIVTVIVIVATATATATEIATATEGDGTLIWRGTGGVAGRHVRPEVRNTAVSLVGLRL